MPRPVTTSFKWLSRNIDHPEFGTVGLRLHHHADCWQILSNGCRAVEADPSELVGRELCWTCVGRLVEERDAALRLLEVETRRPRAEVAQALASAWYRAETGTSV